MKGWIPLEQSGKNCAHLLRVSMVHDAAHVSNMVQTLGKKEGGDSYVCCTGTYVDCTDPKVTNRTGGGNRVIVEMTSELQNDLSSYTTPAFVMAGRTIRKWGNCRRPAATQSFHQVLVTSPYNCSYDMVANQRSSTGGCHAEALTMGADSVEGIRYRTS